MPTPAPGGTIFTRVNALAGFRPAVLLARYLSASIWSRQRMLLHPHAVHLGRLRPLGVLLNRILQVFRHRTTCPVTQRKSPTSTPDQVKVGLQLILRGSGLASPVPWAMFNCHAAPSNPRIQWCIHCPMPDDALQANSISGMEIVTLVDIERHDSGGNADMRD